MKANTITSLPIAPVFDGKTSLLLGAGAARDYGFPTWDGLCPLVVEQLNLYIDDEAQPWAHGLNEYSETAKTALLLLEGMSEDDTIDGLVEREARNCQGLEAFFRRTVGYVLVQLEAADIKDDKTGWIENMRLAFLEHLQDRHDGGETWVEILRDVRTPLVTTLNYDRTFEYHFYPGLKEEVAKLVGPTDFQRFGAEVIWRSVFHPHGANGAGAVDQPVATTSGQGYLNPSNNVAVGYGDVDRLVAVTKQEEHENFPYIYTVDSLTGTDQPTYKQVQGKFARIQRFLVIGVSPEGQNQAQLDFTKITASSIQMTNSATEFAKAGLQPEEVWQADINQIELLGAHADKLF